MTGTKSKVVFVIFIVEDSVSFMSLDELNELFSEYQDELVIRDRKLKLLVDFSVDTDSLLSLLSDIKDKQVIL